ncbi:hypothetical protein ACFP2T_01965 [Plantactinospora solaniradicis]|uniref:4Fe-4S Wbl-type domain-containing protein n=1 Tax=Plantactinospora solaniradicis TaxID=1723736 RepID=A0ABW1K398_9ACTN
MSRPVRHWSLAVEHAAARWILRFHALRRCVDCDPDGCAVWDWAVEVHRRERVIAVLRGGKLPASATIDDLHEALDRIR